MDPVWVFREKASCTVSTGYGVPQFWKQNRNRVGSLGNYQEPQDGRREQGGSKEPS